MVRITNSRIICQIIHATLAGDRVLCAADSTEFKKWGLNAGLTNYPTAYCTGLLLARRLLKQLKMDTMYQGKTEADGKRYDVSKGSANNAERRPFKALLDVGLARTTTGSRVFGALKGACDGGLYIPHHTRRFPGSSKSNKKKKVKYDADAHRNRIFGNHIETYTYGIEEKEGEEAYNAKYGNWSKCIDAFMEADVLDEDGSYATMYAHIHAKIREDPTFTKKAPSKQEHPIVKEEVYTRGGQGQVARYYKGKGGKLYRKDRRLTKHERKANVEKKIEAFNAIKLMQAEAAEAEDDDSDDNDDGGEEDESD